MFEAVKNVDSDILTMIKREQAEKLRLTASDVYIDDFISDLEKNGVSALTPNSEAYPTELKYIADPPFVLYARGKCARLQAETPFAIIGARRCSDYGKKVSAHMGCELAKNGVTIVSGLAYGCDSLAAQGALSAAEQKYPTAAILGQGVCTAKTDGTAEIMEAIIENGCVMSEFLPFTRAAGVPPSTLKNIIHDGSKNPGIVTIKHLCDGLGISLYDFFNTDDFKNSEPESE